MATWDASVRDDLGAVAGGMLCIANMLGRLIQQADPDTDTTVLVLTRDWLTDRANLFSPPGEPAQGYPESVADVINLDAYKAWKALPPERGR